MAQLMTMMMSLLSLQVLVVSGGVIAEQGTHSELLNAGLSRLPCELHTCLLHTLHQE
jgi:ABC-type multidrug transport system fused ATPase/permease subunit